MKITNGGGRIWNVVVWIQSLSQRLCSRVRQGNLPATNLNLISYTIPRSGPRVNIWARIEDLESTGGSDLSTVGAIFECS